MRRTRPTLTLLLALVASSSGFQRQPSANLNGPFIPRQRINRRYVAARTDEDIKSTIDDLLPSAIQVPLVSKIKDDLATKRRTLVDEEERQDLFLFGLAVLPACLAFFAWKDLSIGLSIFLETYGTVQYGGAEGISFSNNLLRPTITGVVVPVIAIALATLVSTTINVLREREVQLKKLINKESCDLRLLRRAVFGLFGTRQHASRRARALALMCSYVEELERESSFGAVDWLEDLQLNGGIAANELDQLTEMLHGIDGAAASRQGSVSYADDLVRSLNEYRSERVAELLSGFPPIHWAVIILLSVSVCATFLLASNQPLNQYLNSISLPALFALLVGVCSGTATICINLADPFSGTFSILESSAQLGDLRLCLEEDVAEATAEAGEISSSLVHAILLGGSNSKDSSIESGIKIMVEPPGQQVGDKVEDIDTSQKNWDKVGNFNSKINKDPQRYGLMSTLFFHLLTGPFASYVKVLGDVIAWVATFVASRTKIFSQQIVALSRGFGRKSWWRRRNVTSENL